MIGVGDEALLKKLSDRVITINEDHTLAKETL